MGRIHQYLLILLVEIFNIYPKGVLSIGDEKEWQGQGSFSALCKGKVDAFLPLCASTVCGQPRCLILTAKEKSGNPE